jgi:hypothetical protein
MIYKIIEEYPDYALMVRFNLVEMQILPDLVTRLTAIYCRDTVSKKTKNGCEKGGKSNSGWGSIRSNF